MNKILKIAKRFERIVNAQTKNAILRRFSNDPVEKGLKAAQQAIPFVKSKIEQLANKHQVPIGHLGVGATSSATVGASVIGGFEYGPILTVTVNCETNPSLSFINEVKSFLHAVTVGAFNAFGVQLEFTENGRDLSI